MKKITITLTTLILFLFIISSQCAAFSNGINWQTYDKGLAMAKAQDKHIFLYFHAEWCHYCKIMKKSTFKDANLINYLNKNFIAIKIDYDKKKQLVKSYNVRGLPTLWFLKQDSTRLSKIPGFINADSLINILKYINTGSYDKMSFHNFLQTI